MPTYEYECSACGHRFDELQSFADKPLSKCPKCKKNKLTRLFGGGGAILFKGSGFYETDYRRAGESKKDEGGESGKSETKTESKTESKSDATPEASSPPPPPPPPPSDSGGKGKGGGKKGK